jgi:hypothetical protein
MPSFDARGLPFILHTLIVQVAYLLTNCRVTRQAMLS